MEKLDYFIEGVLRQGKDSEILELATAIRKGEKLETWRFRNEVLFLKAKPTLEDTFMQYRSFIKVLMLLSQVPTNSGKQLMICIEKLFLRQIIRIRGKMKD